MHTKRLPITPRNTIVDHKVIWNTVAPSGWWRYAGKPGAVDCVTLEFTADVLCVALLYTSFMITISVFYLQERKCLFCENIFKSETQKKLYHCFQYIRK